MKEIKEYYHKVQYYETDAMGIVHHSNYIRWFEEARTDLLEQAGFGYDKMEAAGIIIPVLSASATFKSMVHFPDVVVITPKLEAFGGVKMKLSYEIRDAVTKELRTTGETQHCFLGRDHHPIRLQKLYPDVYELFLSLTNR